MHLHSSNFTKYLVALLRTSFFFPFWGQLTSQWRKCSIKLHYFSGRAANYDSVDKSDQVCNNLAPSFMFASVLIFFAN